MWGYRKLRNRNGPSRPVRGSQPSPSHFFHTALPLVVMISNSQLSVLKTILSPAIPASTLTNVNRCFIRASLDGEHQTSRSDEFDAAERRVSETIEHNCDMPSRLRPFRAPGGRLIGVSSSVVFDGSNHSRTVATVSWYPVLDWRPIRSPCHDLEDLGQARTMLQ